MASVAQKYNVGGVKAQSSGSGNPLLARQAGSGAAVATGRTGTPSGLPAAWDGRPDAQMLNSKQATSPVQTGMQQGGMYGPGTVQGGPGGAMQGGAMQGGPGGAMPGGGQSMGGTRHAQWGGTGPVEQWGGSGAVMPTWQGGQTQLQNFDPNSVNVEEDPGYQFRLQEGLKAIRRQGAAGSGGRGGATMKALTKYGQGMASQEFANAYDRAVGRYQMDRANTMDERGMRRDDYTLGMGEYERGRQADVQDYGMRRDADAEGRNRQLQDYNIGRENLRDERGFAERDFAMGMETSREARSRAVQDHQMARQAALDQRQFAESDFDMQMQTAREQRARDFQDYNIGRQNVIDQRGFAVEDREFWSRESQRAIDNAMRDAGLELAKYESGHQVRQADARLALDKYGMDKEVEFRSREQQQIQSQNRFNNVLTTLGVVGGLASSFF